MKVHRKSKLFLYSLLEKHFLYIFVFVWFVFKLSKCNCEHPISQQQQHNQMNSNDNINKLKLYYMNKKLKGNQQKTLNETLISKQLYKKLATLKPETLDLNAPPETTTPITSTTTSESTTTTTSTQQQNSNLPLRRRICYYANWAPYRGLTPPLYPDQIDPSLCTHIHFAFARIDPKNFSILPTEEHDINWTAHSNMPLYIRLYGLKRRNNNLKILLAIGGL